MSFEVLDSSIDQFVQAILICEITIASIYNDGWQTGKDHIESREYVGYLSVFSLSLAVR